MKLISNTEWEAIEEYTAHLKQQKANAETRATELMIENVDLRSKLDKIKTCNESDTATLTKELHVASVENASLKATLQGAINLLNKVIPNPKKVGIAQLLDIQV